MSDHDMAAESKKGIGLPAFIGKDLLILCMIGLLVGVWLCIHRIGRLEHSLQEMSRELAAVHKDSQIVVAKLRTADDGLVEAQDSEQELRFASIADAQATIDKLGESPKAQELADALYAIDTWLIKPDQEKEFQQLKLAQVDRLRRLVKDRSHGLARSGTHAESGTAGAKEHAEAARILALFPMADDAEVVEEAKALSTRQAEVANRLEGLRRQRYNRWAVERVGQALDYFNANVSRYNPFADNVPLINSLVLYLSDVDPAFLEPAVLELYNYVIDRTKGSISEKNKLELAKRLTDPAVQRKTLGDL